jgi:hypothetical protein
MPGVERITSGIQTANSTIIPRLTTLDARVEPAHDEAGEEASRRLVLGLVYM